MFALWVPSVVKALEIWFMIAPMMGLVFWIGLLWRRMTVVGAWATTLSGFIAWWVSTQSWFIDLVTGLAPSRILAADLDRERHNNDLSALANSILHDYGGGDRSHGQFVHIAGVA